MMPSQSCRVRRSGRASELPHRFQNRNGAGTVQAPPCSTMTLARDLEQGEHWIREALDYWVSRSHRTTRQMAAIACWGLGERAPLGHSKIGRAHV